MDGWKKYVEDPDSMEQENGYIDLPTGPGLGVEIDEDEVRELDSENLDLSRPIYE